MAFIYNLTDNWNDATATWNGIKLAVTNSGSSASSNLLNLTVTGASTASFVVDKSGNLALNGTVNKITFTAPATAATLTLADNSTFITSGAYSSTFTFSGTTTLTFPTSGTVTALGNTTTGSGSIVLATSPTLVTPALGTPSSGILSSCTGYAVGNLTGTGTGVLTALAVNVGSAGAFVTFNGALGTPASGNLGNCTGYPSSGLTGLGTGVATALAINVGSAGSIVTNGGALGTPSSGTLTNATGLPLTTGVTGTLPVANGGTGITSFGTGVATALGVNVGSAGAFVVNGGALGTPSSGTLTNATGLPIGTGVSGLGTGVATFLATPSSANLASAVTDETGSGPLVFATSPTFTSQVTFGTASSTRGTLVLANTSANTVTLQSSNTTAANYTLTFPAAAPVNGYYLQTDTNGVLSWAAGGGGGGGSPGGSNTQVQFNDSATFGGEAAFTYDKTTYTLGLGVASTTTGTFNLYNSASANAVSLKSGNNSAAWTLTLPTSGGTNNYALLTDGSGTTSWGAVATGTISTGTIGQLTYYSRTNTLSGTTTGTGVLTAIGNNTNVAGGVLVPAAALTASAIVLGGGSGTGPATTTTGTGVVTAIGNAVNTAGGLLAPAAALTASALVVGGGSGTGPSTVTTGTDVVTALGVNVGTAGAFVVNGGALGTPSSGNLSSCTNIPVNQATGTLAVANGGTGLTSGTSGGVLYYSATGTLASSAALAASSLVIGGGAGVAPSTTTTGAGILTFLGTPSSANLATAVTDETGSGSLVFATSPSLTTPTLGVASATSINKVAITAPATSATLTIADGKTLTSSNTITLAATNDSQTYTLPAATCNIGYLEVPQNSQSAAYTTVLADSGKQIFHPSTDNNARTFTIPANSSVAYPVGTVITFINQINTLTIAITSDTMTLAGTSTTGSRTLAVNGIATAIKVGSTNWIISGTGLT